MYWHSRRSSRREIAIAAFAATAAILAAHPAHAGTETWLGNADTTWSNSANWTGTNLPPISGDSLIFAAVGSQGATLNDSEGALTLAGLNFDSATGPYVINPAAVATNTLDFSAGAVISNNSAFLQTINTEAVGSSSFTVQGTGNIAMQRVRMSNSATNNVLTMNGTGTLTLGNVSATNSNNNLALVVNSGNVNLGMNGSNIAIDRGLTINAGQVTFTGNSTNMISSGQAVALAGTSVLELAGDSDTIGALTGTSGTVQNSAASTTSTLTIGANVGTTTFANGTFGGNLVNSGTGILAIGKTGSGSETLSGNNTYTGATTISNGTLNIAAASALPSASGVVFNYGGVSLNSGGLVNATGSPLTLSNAVTMPGNAIFNGTGNFTFTTPAITVATTGTKDISLGGSGNVTFTGTFSNSNDSSWSLFNQGNLYPFQAPSGVITLGGINISVAANDTFTLGGWANVTVTGAIANGGTATASILTVSNIGTTTLQAANTFGGNMNLGPAGAEPAGTVAVGNAQSLGLGTVVWNSFALQSTTALTGANAIANPITLQGGAQTNAANGNNAQISGTNAIQLSGTFTNFGGNRSLLVTNTGGTTISGSVYLSEVSGTGRTMTVLANGPVTISGIISNYNGSGTAGGLTVVGTSTLTLSGANIYTGATTLSGGGTLKLDYTTQSNSKISSTAALVANGGETLNLNGGSFVQAVSATTLSGGGDLNVTQSSGTSTLQMATIGRSNGSGLNVATAGIATTNTSDTAAGIIGGWATVGGTDWAVSAASASNTAITALPAAGYQTGADSTWLTTDNVSISGSGNLTGSRTINTLKVASTASGQSLNLGSTFTQTLNAGGLLFTGSNNYTISGGTIKPGQASSPEVILNQWGAGTLTINSVIANGTAASQLTKLGSGAVVLGSTNTYTGTTFVDNGTLALGVNNAINYNASSPQDIQVAGGGVFDLAGHTQTTRNLNIVNNVIAGGTVTSSAPGGVLTENTTITNGSNSNVLYAGQLALVLSEPGTGTSNIAIQLSNPLNNFSGGVTVSGSGTFSTSQLSTAGAAGTNLSSWVGTSDLRLNANTAAGTGTITLNDGRVWTTSTTFYTISNNIAVTANGGWLASDNSSNAYLGTISTVSGSPLLVVGGDTNSRPNTNLWGSMSGFTGTLAVDTENSNVNLYGSSLGSSNANLMFYNNGSVGSVGWSGSIAAPVTINFAELSTFTNSTGGHLTANVAANVTFQIGDNTTNTTTFSGVVQNGSGLVALTKIGTNNQILSGVQTYTGATTVNGGTLSISGSLNSGSASTVTGGTLLAVGSSGSIPGSVTVNGGAAGVTTGGTISGGVTVNAGGSLIALGTSTVGATAGTFSGPVTIVGGASTATRGSINLVDNTIKTVNLTGGLTLGGTTAGASSSMSFDFGASGNNSDLLALTGSPLTVNLGGATISLSNLGTNPGGGQTYTLMTFPSATGAGFATGTGTTVGDLSLATTNFGPLSTQLIVTSTALEVQVNGTVVTPTSAYWTGMVDNKWNSFSGTNANFATTAAGTTSISGFLGATTDVYFGANSASNLSTTLGQNFTIQTLNFTGTGTSGTGAYTINGNTSGASLLTIAGNGSGTGITLAAGSGGATINVSSLVLGSSQTWTNNSTNPLTVNSSISQGGTDGLTFAAGMFILGGSNSYSGGTSINAGLVQLTGSATLGASGNTLTMTGGTLDLHGVSLSVGQLTGSTGTVIENNGTGTATLSFASDNSGGGNFQGNIVDNTNSGTGKVAVAMTGAGSATLSGANTFTGGTSITGGGTLNVGSPSALGAASNTLTLTNSSTLQLNGYSESVTSLSGSAGTTISNTTSTPVNLTVNVPGSTSTAFLGTISDNGAPGTLSLVKTGTGTLVLSANGNSFNGNASIQQGTVGVNSGSDLGNGTITIGDGSTAAPAGILLGGAGYTISNPVTIAAGGTGTYSIVSNTNVDFIFSGPITLNNNLFLSCNVGHAVFLNGVITGSSTITVDGGGTSGSSSFNNFFVFGASDAGTFTGNINIQNGGFVKLTTNVPANTVLGVPTLVTMGTATTFDTGGATFTIAGLNGTVGADFIDFQGAFTIGGSGNYTFAGLIQNSGSVVMSGTGRQTLSGSNTYTGGTNAASGTLVFAAPYALPNFTSLTVSGTVVAASHGTGVIGANKNNLFASSLSLAGATGNWTGKLDLNNNDMVVQNGNLAQITNQVAQGYDNGTWNNGGGIVSSTAAADSKHLTALGVIQNSVDGTTTGAVLYSAFDGATAAAATDVLVKYTYYGDTDLSGVVDGSDYSRIDNGFLSQLTATPLGGWFNGDFNYDGVIDGSDYTLMDNAFNSQGAAIAAQVAAPTAQLAGGTSAVPEPTTLGLLGISVIGLLGRRNRRRN